MIYLKPHAVNTNPFKSRLPMPSLVIAAHPDDEVLGCGGTIARLIRQGDDVRILILSDGESSRHTDPRSVSPESVAARRSAAKAACRLLGAPEPLFLEFPDNRMDTVPLLDITKAIEAAIHDFNPETVFTHHAGDMNVDHRLVAHAVLTATRPVPGSVVKRVYAYEVLSSSHVAAGHFGPPFVANTFVDISETLDAKLDAMQCYDAELRPYPHPRSIEAIRSLAVTRGASCGMAAAEAFVLIRETQSASP